MPASRSSRRRASSSTRSPRTCMPEPRWHAVPATCTARSCRAARRAASGAGLGQSTSTGTVSLIVPTDYITTTGEERTIDGVRIVFQMAPGTEAPSEMHFHFPDRRALCMAENATHTLHNLLTLRGALVRDPHVWAQYLSEAIETFADDTDVVFASHHWPTWGRENIVEFLSLQRDLYAYLHDQTLRLLNKGFTGSEIAEQFRMPPALEAAWHTHGYYGSVSHNVKAIYQRYMGWYDGNPARLWQHPPEAAAKRYVEFMGGADAVVEKARASFDGGRPPLDGAGARPRRVRRAGPRRARRRSWPTRSSSSASARENGTWRGAFLVGRDGAAHRQLRHAHRDGVGRHPRRAPAGAAPRRRSRSRSTARRPGTSTSRRGGTSPTRDRDLPGDAAQRRARRRGATARATSR